MPHTTRAEQARIANLLHLADIAAREDRQRALDAAAAALLPPQTVAAMSPETRLHGHWDRVWPSGNYVRHYSENLSAHVSPFPATKLPPARFQWSVATCDALLQHGTSPSIAAAQSAADTFAQALS